MRYGTFYNFLFSEVNFFFVRIPETLFVLFLSLLTVSTKEHNCTIKPLIVSNQSYFNCELTNIKFVGLEAFTINANKSEVFKKTAPGSSNKDAVNGTIASETENINATDIDAVNEMGTKESEKINAPEVEVDPLVLQVKFKSSNIAVVPNEIFHKFKSLQIFDASHSNVKNLNALTFNNAAHLQMIFLYNNQLTSISSYVFVHTKLLEVLDLSNNRISRIDQLAFTSLGKLRRLSLSNNRIKSIEDHTFQPLISLKWIWLENNQISMISSDTFTAANRDLHGILLKNNAIESISPFVLDNLPSLRFLDMSGNKCSGSAFKNHAIKDNAAIKFELRECLHNHRKLKLSCDQKYEISSRVNSVVSSFEQCAVDVGNIKTTIELVETQVQVMRNVLNNRE